MMRTDPGFGFLRSPTGGPRPLTPPRVGERSVPVWRPAGPGSVCGTRVGTPACGAVSDAPDLFSLALGVVRTGVAPCLTKRPSAASLLSADANTQGGRYSPRRVATIPFAVAGILAGTPLKAGDWSFCFTNS